MWVGLAATGTPELPTAAPGSTRAYLTGVVAQVEAATGTDAAGCLVLAQIQSRLGEKAAAERWARRALEYDPKQRDAELFLGRLLVRQDRLEEAARCLKNAVSASPETPGAQRELAMVLDRLGDREGAREQLEQSLRRFPSDATAELLLGRWLLDSDEPAAACTHLRRAVELNPSQGGAYYALAEAQDRTGQAEAAQKSRQRFQELKQQEQADLDSQNASLDDARTMRAMAESFHLELAALAVRRGQADEAERQWRQAARVAPDEPRSRELLAEWLVKHRRLPEARDAYLELVQLRPDEVAYRLNLGTVLIQLADAPGAIEQWRRALELQPRQPDALGNLARLLLSTGREPKEALALCERLVAERPAAASYDLLGWALFTNGRLNEARAAAAQAVERDPQNPAYRERLRKLSPAP